MRFFILGIALAAIIVGSLYFGAAVYLQNVGGTQPFDPERTADFKLYYAEFGTMPVLYQNYSFSPPITLYHSLRLALESDGWNASSLEGMKINVALEYRVFISNSFSSGSGFLYQITEPDGNYSVVQIGKNTYRYIARATGEIIPHGPIF